MKVAPRAKSIGDSRKIAVPAPAQFGATRMADFGRGIQISDGEIAERQPSAFNVFANGHGSSSYCSTGGEARVKPNEDYFFSCFA
jgi:hypothetical protein